MEVARCGADGRGDGRVKAEVRIDLPRPRHYTRKISPTRQYLGITPTDYRRKAAVFAPT